MSFLSGDNGGQRESVSDPLSHCHYIWRQTGLQTESCYYPRCAPVCHFEVNKQRFEHNCDPKILQCPYLSGDNSGQRESVSDPLSHGDYIWHHTVAFKSPKMLACSAKPSLDFIGNAKAPMWSYFIEGSSQITFWILNTSSNTLQRKSFLQSHSYLNYWILCQILIFSSELPYFLI